MTDQERISYLEVKFSTALLRIQELEALVLRLSTVKTAVNISKGPFAIIRSVIGSGVKNGSSPFDIIQLIVNLLTPPKAAG